jgi:hypothetical protein
MFRSKIGMNATRRPMLKLDPAKLQPLIATIDSAILDRIEETLTRPSSSEHQVMNDAIRSLRMLQKQAHAWMSKSDRDGATYSSGATPSKPDLCVFIFT